MSLKNKFYFMLIVLLVLAVQLVFLDWIANAAIAPESVNDLETRRWVLEPLQRSLTLISLSPVIADSKTIGALAVYDDPTTQRSEDYLELYASDGELVAVGWFDRFGIPRMAVDRSLLEGKTDLHGQFITVVDGDPI